MECRKCGKKVDEFEIYCDDCKEILKKEKELNELINGNKELNKFEITKEVETLSNFKDEKKETSSRLKEELKDIVNIEEMETILDKKDNKWNIIIIILLIIISLGIFVFIFLNLPKKENVVDNEVPINYKKIINDYGYVVELTVSKYLEDNKEIPSWSIIRDLIKYEDYEVVCTIHNIYNDGKVYLNDCKVDNEKVVYSYGIEKQEIKEGKKIDIYKIDNENNYFVYSNVEAENAVLVGTITCKTENCEYINGYEKYGLIEENNEYYIYNYENNSIEFGPFDILNNNYENNILSYQNILYGILYNTNGNMNIYNINTEKTLKNIDGNLLLISTNFNPSIMYKYGYVIFQNNNTNNFVNLKTGNVSYKIDGKINTFIENNIKKLVYIITYNSENSKITIYNSNGKKLFNGNEFNDIKLLSENIIVSNDNKYYIYDSNLKLKLASKEYNNILGLFEDFIVVVDNECLEIVDLEDNILATYDLKWDSDMYKFDNILSGKTIENNEEVIYLVIERSDKSLKYYYNTVTKEYGLK